MHGYGCIVHGRIPSAVYGCGCGCGCGGSCSGGVVLMLTTTSMVGVGGP